MIGYYHLLLLISFFVITLFIHLLTLGAMGNLSIFSRFPATRKYRHDHHYNSYICWLLIIIFSILSYFRLITTILKLLKITVVIRWIVWNLNYYTARLHIKQYHIIELRLFWPKITAITHAFPAVLTCPCFTTGFSFNGTLLF